MASSLLMFPTGRKPSRKSLRLSDASDVPPPTPPGSTRAMPAALPAAAAVLSTRTPSTSSRHHQNQRTLHALSTTSTFSSTSLEPHSVFSDYIGSVEPIHMANPGAVADSASDRRKGKEVTKQTRHGTVTIRQSPVAVPSTATQSVKSTTTSKRKNSQQGLTDGDLTKDVKRSEPPTLSSPPSVAPSLTPNGSAISATAVKATVTSTTIASSAIASPQGVLMSQKPSKSQAPVSSKDKKTKQDAVVEPEVPNANKNKEKEKELDSSMSSSKSRVKEKGKEKAKATSTPTPTTTVHYGSGDGNAIVSERLGGMPKTASPTPHTFSAFAPHPSSSSSTLPKTNGIANDSNSNHKPLPPPGFSFPPPPPHSPHQQQFQQQQQQQQPKNSLNGSAAAYTYAHRHKASTTPKPVAAGSVSNSIMMNMAALLEEDEDGDGSAPTRRLRHTSNGNANAQRKGKGKERMRSDSTSSRSSSSHSRSPSRSNANSNPHPTSNSSMTTTYRSQSNSEATFRNPPKTLSSEVNAMSVPTPGELPSKGTQGYTSLVLPRAPPPLGSYSTSSRTASTSGSGAQRKWFGSVGKEGKVDLTRSGVAQTTMASVEVVRGLGRQQGQNGFGGKLLGMFGRKRN